MPYFENLKCFFKSKRLAIKSCCFLSILLLVFISAIIMISNDYTQDASYTNTINAGSCTNSLRTFNAEDKEKGSSDDTEVLKSSVSQHYYLNKNS